MSRYRFICVAPGVPEMPSTDDLDEAILATASYYGSHFDIYDEQTGEWVQGATCWEDVGEAYVRIAMREGWPLPVHDPPGLRT